MREGRGSERSVRGGADGEGELGVEEGIEASLFIVREGSKGSMGIRKLVFTCTHYRKKSHYHK